MRSKVEEVMDSTKLTQINIQQLVEELNSLPNWQAIPEEVRTDVINSFAEEVGMALIESTAKSLLPKKTRLKRKKGDGERTEEEKSEDA